MATRRTNTNTCKTRRVSPHELYKMIEKKAYEIYEKRGHTHGNDMKDWMQAEKEVRKIYSA